MWLRRFGFRFGVVFAAILVLPFPLDLIPKVDWLVERYGELWDFAGHRFGGLLGIDVPPTQPTGSGDTTLQYVVMTMAILLAVLGGAIWTALDRERPVVYPRVAAAVRIALRYWLGFAMIGYGVAKVFHSQFPFPTSVRLEEPVGQMSPMGLMWTFMGYSTPYNVFAGGMECLGGVLLMFRRTTMLGSLVVIAVMTNVVMLNFCYDVPVKLYSSTLLAIAFVLLYPDLSRLIGVLSGHAAPAATIERFPMTRRWRRIVLGLKLALFALFAYATVLQIREIAARPTLVIDGRYDVVELVPRDLGWTRVSLASRRGALWTGDNEVPTKLALTDVEPHGLTIAIGDRTNTLDYAHAGNTLILDGTWEQRHVHVVLRQRPLTLLETRGFNWVAEFPFNR